MDPHRLAELRSLAYHRLVGGRLRHDPRLVDAARARVGRWLLEGRAPHYAREWERVLSGPVERICDVLEADTAEARALRQSSPFAGVIGARERWRIWQRVRELAAGWER